MQTPWRANDLVPRSRPVNALGIAAGGKDMSVMGQAVQQRRGQLLVAKDFHPLGEG